MAVITPVVTHTMMATPTELAFSRTPLGLTKIPDPMMLPEGVKKKKITDTEVRLRRGSDTGLAALTVQVYILNKLKIKTTPQHQNKCKATQTNHRLYWERYDFL